MTGSDFSAANSLRSTLIKLTMAVLIGVLSAFVVMPIVSEFCLWWFASAPQVSLIVTVLTFSISGYVTAVMARENEFVAGTILGVIFLVLTVGSYYFPASSDPFATLVTAGLTKLGS